MSFNPKWILGKKVVMVEMNLFDAGTARHNRAAHNPRIYFEDGSSIAFTTEETEGSEYGTGIVYSKPKGKQ
jgi:hypothetical protein